MASMDDAPRIGDLEVEHDAVSAAGVPLQELAVGLGFGVDETTTADAAADGWRVLRLLEGGSAYLGSPVDTDHRRWRVAQVHPGEQPPMVQVHPDTLDLRPSRAERRQALELRWPSFVAEVADPSELVIDIVNAGATRWTPEQEGFHAVGALTAPGETEFSFGWMGSATDRAVPLDPGEYARVPIQLQLPSEPTSLQPGPYDLHVVIVALGLRPAAPLRVHLTADMVARLVARQHRHRSDPASERRAFDREIEAEQLRIGARRSWPAVAEVVGSAASDDEALERIAAVLGTTTDQAASVYDASLRAMVRADASRRDERLQELIRRRDALG